MAETVLNANAQMQLNFGNVPLLRDHSRQATNAGIKQAEDHANKVHSDWSEKAMEFLEGYLRHWTAEFMAEDVRRLSEGIIPEPPTKRAWGAIMQRAAMRGLIRKVGIRPVKNITAHRANATVWKRAGV